MGLKYQCDLNQQNCPSLFREGVNASFVYGTATVSFTNQSCVRDKRLEGNVGRCGFPGAPCVINETASNCASGLAQTCVQGTCQGAPGFPCGSYEECNWGVSCNATRGEGGGICGGNRAGMRNDAIADGPDFGRNYCASGAAVKADKSNYWSCSPGTLAFVSNATYAPSGRTSTPTPAPLLFVGTTIRPTAAIVGGVIGGTALLLLLLSIFWHIRDGWGLTGRRFNKAVVKEFAGWPFERLAFLPRSLPRKSRNATPLRSPSGSLPSQPQNGEKSSSLSLSSESKRGWISRILLFLALEMGYLGLLAVASFQPIVLPGLSLAHLTEAKGVTTIFTIAWQTLAILPITDILSTIFSSEWSHSFWRTGELNPGKTDRFSLPTAGIFDRSKHFCTSNSSLAFRLAFPASLLAQALVGIAPGALTVNTVSIPSAVRTEVGSIDIKTMGSHITTPSLVTQRPGLIARMEQVEHGQYGFRTSENGVLVGWPQLSTLTATTGNLTYPSDIVRFNYECRWAAPALVDISLGGGGSVVTGGIWAVDGKTSDEEVWTAFGDTRDLSPTAFANSGIFPLEQKMGDLSVSRTSSNGVSAWLFLGSNSSYAEPEKGWENFLDLGDVPASYNETSHWTLLEPGTTDPDVVKKRASPLASVLLCDPKMVMSSAYVTLVTESNTLLISNATLASHLGNISKASAALVFVQGLLGATAINCDYSGRSLVLCITSASIFLQEPRGPLDLTNTHTAYLRSVANISSNIGPYVASASKAWSDGLYTQDPGKFSGMSVDAVKGIPKLAFVASRPLTITVGVLVFIILELVAAELWIPVGEPLGIASLKDALNLEGS